MGKKDKIITQIIICCVIFTGVRMSSMIQSESIQGINQKIKEAINQSYTLEDVKTVSGILMGKAQAAPTVIINTVNLANLKGKFTHPIDEESSETLQPVFAVGDGLVTYSGIDKDLGYLIKIKHDDNQSVYGNLHKISIVNNDKVKKGEIIGYYNNAGDKKFYYSLDDIDSKK